MSRKVGDLRPDLEAVEKLYEGVTGERAAATVRKQRVFVVPSVLILVGAYLLRS